jgi:cytochrome c-type biogenesis protein
MITLDEFLRQFGSGLSQGLPLALGVSFLAGTMASAVCPCTLPVGLGMASVSGAQEAEGRLEGLRVAAAFFAGIVLNLALLGALTGRLGALATESFGRSWALAMALLSLLAAVGAFRGPRLKVRRLEALRRPGLAGAFGYGFVFSLGTSVAPLLLLLTVSAARGLAGHGFLLALAFGIGRGLPFLLAGLIGSVITEFARLARWRGPIQVLSGGVLLAISAYYTRTFAALL